METCPGFFVGLFTTLLSRAWSGLVFYVLSDGASIASLLKSVSQPERFFSTQNACIFLCLVLAVLFTV